MERLTRLRRLSRACARTAIALAASYGICPAAAQAKNVVWVSFQPTEDASPNAAAANPMHIVAPDKAYTDLIKGAGYTVTRVLTAEGPPTQAALDAIAGCDLIIIGRSQNSAFFDSAPEWEPWNTAAKPMIVMAALVTRSNRLGLNSGTAQTDATLGDYDNNNVSDGADFLTWQRNFGFVTNATPAMGDADGNANIQAADLPYLRASYGTDGRSFGLNVPVASQTHPIFAGISFDASNNTVNPFGASVTFEGVQQRSNTIVTSAIAPGGTLLATAVSPGVVATAPMIYEFAAGAASTNGTVFGEKRLVFLSGSREVQLQSFETAGLMDLSADGQKMFVNAVKYMTGGPATPVSGAVPEPATGGLALAAAIGLLAARRRR